MVLYVVTEANCGVIYDNFKANVMSCAVTQV